MSDALSLAGVTKRFGQFTAVDHFDLRLAAGQVLGFLGPNGAGKTTTIRMIMSIIYPDSGTITVLGHPRAEEVKDRIGYLPEERGLYPKMTVRETLEYFGRLKGLRGPVLKQRIDAALERVGLKDWHRKRLEALSKGMSQKIQFLSAILHQPELVILDEPFSGLDPLNTEMLESLIADLRKAGTTVIFSTHQMNQAERLCDRIVLINKGRQVIEGTLTDVRSRFADTRIAVIDAEGDLQPLATLPGVASAEITASHARLRLTDAAETHEVLSAALQHVRIVRFELQRPDLQEIFVRLVSETGGSVRPLKQVALQPAEVAHG